VNQQCSSFHTDHSHAVYCVNQQCTSCSTPIIVTRFIVWTSSAHHSTPTIVTRFIVWTSSAHHSTPIIGTRFIVWTSNAHHVAHWLLLLLYLCVYICLGLPRRLRISRHSSSSTSAWIWRRSLPGLTPTATNTNTVRSEKNNLWQYFKR